MKAIIARAFAPLDQLDYADWPEPEAAGSTVVIAAEAIGVNFPDGLLVQGLYQMKPQLPFVPGMEVAGRVVSVGPEVEILAELDGDPVLVRQGGVLLAAFHPELTDDTRVHELYVDMVREETHVGA